MIRPFVLALVAVLFARAPTLAPADLDPSSPYAQCVARCCPWSPDVDREKYVACLKRNDGPCLKDPKTACAGPPISWGFQ